MQDTTMSGEPKRLDDDVPLWINLDDYPNGWVVDLPLSLRNDQLEKPMSVAMRIEVEKKIVGQFVKDALAAGYRLAVSLERGYDHDEMLYGSRDFDKIMEEAFAGDECHIFIQPAEGPTANEHGSVISEGWVFCVMGNDGWDVISDYSANDLTEKLLTEANKIADHYS